MRVSPWSVNSAGRFVVNGLVLPVMPTGPAAPVPGTPLIAVVVKGRHAKVVFSTVDDRWVCSYSPRRQKWTGWRWSRTPKPALVF